MNVIDSNNLEHDVVRKPVPTFRHHALAFPMRTRRRLPVVGLEISRFPHNERPHMPVCPTEPDQKHARNGAPLRIAFRLTTTSACEMSDFRGSHLSLYMQASTREVLRCLVEGPHWLRLGVGTKIAGKSGFSQARTRLDAEVPRNLHDKLAVLITTPAPDTKFAYAAVSRPRAAGQEP